MCWTRSWTSSRSSTERAIGRRRPATVAVRHPPAGARPGATPVSAIGAPATTSSVTLVPLLLPRVAPVVVAVLLPEAGLVALHHGDPADPLGALPEVQVWHQHPHRAAVLDRQGLTVELPDHPGLAAGDVLDRQVGGVAGLRRRHDEAPLGGGPGDVQQRVDADAAEPGVELRPGRDAVDVTAVLGAGQRMRLVPAPGGRVLDLAVDADAPRLGRDPRRRLGGEHRPVTAHVVLAGWQPRVAGGAA